MRPCRTSLSTLRAWISRLCLRYRRTHPPVVLSLTNRPVAQGVVSAHVNQRMVELARVMSTAVPTLRSELSHGSELPPMRSIHAQLTLMPRCRRGARRRRPPSAAAGHRPRRRACGAACRARGRGNGPLCSRRQPVATGPTSARAMGRAGQQCSHACVPQRMSQFERTLVQEVQTCLNSDTQKLQEVAVARTRARPP